MSTGNAGQVGSESYALVLALSVVISVLYLLNKTRIGHTLIYYGLVLLIVVTIATQYQWFSAALAPLSGLGNTNAANSNQGVTV